MRPERRLRLTRSHAIVRVQRRLEREGYPRAQMALIVALTGAAGLLASFVLLHAGLQSMAWRYPLALGLAYLFFLSLLWLWLRTRAEDYAEVPDLSDLIPGPGRSGGGGPTIHSGGGGDFGGGGAGASFDGPDASSLAESAPLDGLGSSVGDAAGSALDADELAIPLAVLALAIGLACASLYVVYVAPSVLAELLLDGALSYSLYRHLRSEERGHWLATAWRRTAWPFALTAVFLAGAGAAMAAYAPGARSIGEVMHHAGSPAR